MWQVSTVCKKLQAAAKLAVSSNGRVELWNTDQHDWQQCRVDSALLLSWAPHVYLLGLRCPSTTPGLPAFLEAAGRLEELTLHCHSPLEAAQSAYILPSCRTEVALTVRGTHTPPVFPPLMASLHVDLFKCMEDTHGDSVCECMTPSVILYSLARQQGLKVLELDTGMTRLELDFPLSLPELEVCIGFTLRDNTVIDFSWLLHQPCRWLRFTIHVATDLPSQHQHVVDWLRQLPVDMLQVFGVSLAPEIQSMWAQLSIRHYCSIQYTIGWEPPIPALQALPCCPRIVVAALSGSELTVDWAAVTSQAGQISFELRRKSLRFCGGSTIPPFLQKAWQLTVKSATSVHGLQGAHVIDGVHVLQNAAAESAGLGLNLDPW